MPTYEYKCRSCGHVFEIVQKMSDDPLVICPECGGELRKVFAPPAISFRGSGFYATDHGKKAKPAKERESAAASSTTSGDAGNGPERGKETPKKDTATDGGGSKAASGSDGAS